MFNYPKTFVRFLTLAFIVLSLAGTGLSAADCPPTKPATYRGPIAPNGPWITYQCPELCGTQPGTFLRRVEDVDFMDLIYVWCPNVAEERAIPSSSTCWNCVDGCAGSNCPPGELCLPKAKQSGYDCFRWGCDDPAYTIMEGTSENGWQAYCRRVQPCPEDPPVQQCVPASVWTDGPTTIRPGTSCTWSAGVFSECPSSAYTYHWYAGTMWVGSGEYYTGGRPSGVLIGSPWRLRVEAIYNANGQIAGSREFWVSESSSAPICMN